MKNLKPLDITVYGMQLYVDTTRIGGGLISEELVKKRVRQVYDLLRKRLHREDKTDKELDEEIDRLIFEKNLRDPIWVKSNRDLVSKHKKDIRSISDPVLRKYLNED